MAVLLTTGRISSPSPGIISFLGLQKDRQNTNPVTDTHTVISRVMYTFTSLLGMLRLTSRFFFEATSIGTANNTPRVRVSRAINSLLAEQHVIVVMNEQTGNQGYTVHYANNINHEPKTQPLSQLRTYPRLTRTRNLECTGKVGPRAKIGWVASDSDPLAVTGGRPIKDVHLVPARRAYVGGRGSGDGARAAATRNGWEVCSLAH